MSASSSPKDLVAEDESPIMSKKLKNFSAVLKARVKAESKTDRPSSYHHHEQDLPPRPVSSASTVRPDSVLSFRSEIPNVKQCDFGAFRPESVSILPPDVVTTIRPDSVAAVQGAGQGVFRPFQAPSGPTARFNIQYQASSESDWEAKDEMRQRELEEMRARAAQMEKTMRWWSDCTANWREKWSKVRNERNKTREDCRQLRSKLEVVVKECTGLKREKQDLHSEIDKLKAEIELSSIKDPDKDSDSMSTGSNISIKSHPDDTNLASSAYGAPDDDSNQRAHTSKLLPAGMLEAKLKELTKMYNAEKEEKASMKYKLDDLNVEINSLKTELVDLTNANRKLQSRLKDVDQSEAVRSAGSPSASSGGEVSEDSRSEQQVELLRGQLERMQVENAAEWAKREKLSSEKHSLERENKKLRNFIEELQGEVRKRQTGLASAKDQDIKSLQDELVTRNKEYSDLRQVYSKQKKLLADSSTELNHANRRSEQYEQEVRKLRARIEELKDDLMTAENEIDTQSNLVRKLQRTNDDLQEMGENYQAQNAHLQTRLRSAGVTDGMESLIPPVLGGASSEDDDDENFGQS